VRGSGATLKERVARYRQIKISVIGRKSGKTISMPVWFVLEGQKRSSLFNTGFFRQFNVHVGQTPDHSA
jgi:hypothetical protein